MIRRTTFDVGIKHDGETGEEIKPEDRYYAITGGLEAIDALFFLLTLMDDESAESESVAILCSTLHFVGLLGEGLTRAVGDLAELMHGERKELLSKRAEERGGEA